MEVQFTNLRTIEQEKAKFGFNSILISKKRRGHKDTGYTYFKHKKLDPVTKQWVESDTYIRMAADETGQHTYAVAEAISRDIQVNGAPNPDRVIIIQDVLQENSEGPVPTLMYAPERETEFAL